jgi:hypothetical protein
MNANELRDHFRETAKSGKLADHLRDEHGISNPPANRQAQDRLHKTVHEAASQEADRNASVIAGVTRKPEEVKTTTRKAPARKAPAKTAPATRKAPAAKPAPAKAVRKPAARKAPAKTTAKPARKAPAKVQSEANGATPRERNTAMAVELVTLVAEHFKSRTPAEKAKLAYWLHSLPTGGAGYQRWWPAGFPKPQTADWRKPE